MRPHGRQEPRQAGGEDRGKLAKRVRWELTRGGKARADAEWLARVAAEDPAAAAYAEAAAESARPPEDCELPPGGELYLDAFWQLSTDRPQSGFGVHPIPFTAIDAYARRYGVEGCAFEDLANAVRAADAAFIDVMAKKLKDETAKRK